MFLNRTLAALAAISMTVCSLLQAQTDVRIPERLTLKEARSLLDSNPALQAKKQEIDAEKGDVLDVKRYPNPTFSFGSEGLVFDSERGSFVDRLQPLLTLRQEFLTGGKRDKRTRVEMADTEIASIQVEDLLRLLNYDLKQVYYQVVLAERDLELARRILQRFKEIVQLNRTRFESGEISGGELRRTEAAEYPFLAAVVDAEVRLDSAKVDLLALVGSSDFTQQFQAADSFNPSFSPPSEGELREIALRQRPDLAAERARVTRADLAIELEQARSKPNPTAFAGYQRQIDSNGPIAGIELPLFVFNQNEGPIHRAQAERRRQENQLLFGQIMVLKEVSIALEQLAGGRRRIQALENEYLEKAEQARDITEASYRLGEASLIEFLDAERTYSETMLLYNQALYDFEISRARLERAIGEDL